MSGCRPSRPRGRHGLAERRPWRWRSGRRCPGRRGPRNTGIRSSRRRSSMALELRLRRIDAAGPRSRQGRRTCPRIVGATRRPSLRAWLGSRNQGTVVMVSTISVAPVPAKRGGNTRKTLTMRSQVSPTMASTGSPAIRAIRWLDGQRVPRPPTMGVPADGWAGAEVVDARGRSAALAGHALGPPMDQPERCRRGRRHRPRSP